MPSDLMASDLTIEQVPEIEHDLKKIKVTNFRADFERFLTVLPHIVEERDHHLHHKLFRIPGLGQIVGEVYKAKKIHCVHLRCNDKFRVIFQLHERKIRILEVYFKGQKENHDVQRILKYCRSK